jgi:hypothetical protein
VKHGRQAPVVLVSLLALGAVFGAFIGALPSQLFVCAAVWTLAVAFVGYLLATDRLSSSAISPVVIVCGLAAVYGIVVPLTLAARQETFLTGVNYGPAFLTASTACGLAALSFAAGYARGRGRTTAPQVVAGDLSRAGRDHVARVARGLLVAATIVTMYRVFRYGLGGWTIKLSEDRSYQEGVTAYVTYGPQYLAGVLLFFAYRGATRAVRRAAMFLCALVTFYFLAGGARYQVIVMLGAFALLWYWRLRRRDLPPLRYLGVAALVGLLLLGALGNLRSQATAGFSPGIGESVRNSFEVFLPLAGLIEHTERAGFLFGTSYAYVAYQVVPRSVWPGKPYPPTVTALGQFTDIRQGRSFPLWGELFLNFGWYGVVGGMALLGYGVRRWMDYWRAHRHSFETLDILAAITIPLLVQWVSRGLFVQLVYNTMGLLVGPLALYVVERRARRQPAAGQRQPAAAVL